MLAGPRSKTRVAKGPAQKRTKHIVNSSVVCGIRKTLTCHLYACENPPLKGSKAWQDTEINKYTNDGHRCSAIRRNEQGDMWRYSRQTKKYLWGNLCTQKREEAPTILPPTQECIPTSSKGSFAFTFWNAYSSLVSSVLPTGAESWVGHDLGSTGSRLDKKK